MAFKMKAGKEGPMKKNFGSILTNLNSECKKRQMQKTQKI